MTLEQDRSDYSNFSIDALSRRYVRYAKILETGEPPENEIELTREYFEESDELYNEKLLKQETLEGIKCAMEVICDILAQRVKLN